ncbi:carbohydrate sulfotransferase 15-like [Pomacea canaliculata]|uniref:carbohydrate sulfotransferase 15-like n=1 Tax=Pomacea canaliculata TaxID=400727 RepID=UPI000D72FA21|nr:carbohydrate sulfotransferase 15-like [Pomacea canaliculata]
MKERHKFICWNQHTVMGWSRTRMTVLLAALAGASIVLSLQWSHLQFVPGPEKERHERGKAGQFLETAVYNGKRSEGKPQTLLYPVNKDKALPIEEFVGDRPLFKACITNIKALPSSPSYRDGFVGPFLYISQSKNPCWWRMTNNTSRQLNCVPYFFLAGVSKSGSTDIFFRLMEHPQIVQPKIKELRWFDIRRYTKDEFSFNWYVSNFEEAARNISRDIEGNGYSLKIIGDGSPTYFWRNYFWNRYPGNEGCTEPRIVVPSMIHHLVPQAKIIISLRNPIHSIYSKYLTLADKGIQCSPKHFHNLTVGHIQRYYNCFQKYGVRSCVYNISLSSHSMLRLEKGIYVVFLVDWLRIFPQQQIHVVRFEDYIKNIPRHLSSMFEFLEIAPMPEYALQELSSRPVSNRGRHYSVGAMLPATEKLLQKFYAPFNEQLAEVLKIKITYGEKYSHAFYFFLIGTSNTSCAICSIMP